MGRHLAYLDRSKPQLHYWLREGRANNAEIDYVISQGTKIFPIEVKSGSSGTLKSLQQFVLEKGCGQAIRFDLNQPSRMMVDVKARSGNTVEDVRFELLSLPLYAVESLAQ